MRMQLSADGRYYHGQSKTDGYVYVEVAILEKSYQEWDTTHPRASKKMQSTIEALNHSANFWDMVLLSGVHILQHYLIVDCLPEDHYDVKCFDRGRLLWQYVTMGTQLLLWLTPIYPCLVHTNNDNPRCGIYAVPVEPVPELWNTPAPIGE